MRSYFPRRSRFWQRLRGEKRGASEGALPTAEWLYGKQECLQAAVAHCKVKLKWRHLVLLSIQC